VSFTTLIHLKRATGRFRDLDAIAEVEMLRQRAWPRGDQNAG
jgi:hypothetical protein